jgi:hypothetical protein
MKDYVCLDCGNMARSNNTYSKCPKCRICMSLLSDFEKKYIGNRKGRLKRIKNIVKARIDSKTCHPWYKGRHCIRIS